MLRPGPGGEAAPPLSGTLPASVRVTSVRVTSVRVAVDEALASGRESIYIYMYIIHI